MQCLRRFVCNLENRFSSCSEIKSICKRPRVTVQSNIYRFESDSVESDVNENKEEETYRELSDHYLGTALGGHRAFVIQPYIKWGVQKKRNTSRELQLEEAVALINSLPNWSVAGTVIVPLLTLQKKQLVGTGAFEDLKKRINQSDCPTAIFVSTSRLQHVQVLELEKGLGLPVYDRYTIIIHIFRHHAVSPEAKLQVALAELPYIRSKISEIHAATGKVIMTETTKMMLDAREKKLKHALHKLKNRRESIRNYRKHQECPSIAVVGYTNAGKTSLIRALTGDDSLKPKDKLFATLDTTAHEGLLPCRLKVLYMDTIGFIQDVPETLIEPFRVTLEDALVADIIVHVYDVSHPDMTAQFEHTEKTIQSMVDENKPIIRAANKCDRVNLSELPKDTLAVSATKLTGIDVLRQEIEKKLLAATGRMRVRIKVETGSTAAAWLYKYTTVTNAEPDPENFQYVFLDTITTSLDLMRFKQFLKK